MGVDAEDLIVRPFHEVVDRGNEAIANAGKETPPRDDLARCGHALVREGERALKRLRPIWDGQVARYGDAFTDAMRQHDSIDQHRRAVDDLLYDFDDYLDPDTFDASRFAALQAATRSFALDVINVMRRLKLEGAAGETEDKRKSVFPPLPPLPAMPPMPPLPFSVPADRRSRASLGKPARMSAATLSTNANGGDELLLYNTTPSTSRSPPAAKLRRASTKSSASTSYQLYDHPGGYDVSVMEHPHIPPPPPPPSTTTTTIPRTSAWVSSHQQPPGSAPASPTAPSAGLLPRFSALHLDDSTTTSSSAYTPSSPTMLTDGGARTSYLSSAATSYTPSLPEHHFEEEEDVDMDVDYLESMLRPQQQHQSRLGDPPSVKKLDDSLMTADVHPKDDADSAADSATSTSDLPMTRREWVRAPDCRIGPHSTFALMGGGSFCKGADLFRAGGHWQGIKQTGGYVANKQASIGRCVGCGYAHNYEEVRLDIEGGGTFTMAGARFRLRLLYKSHLRSTASSARQAESHYACVFCVHAGATVREGDATVFTTPDHLLRHLARHPQPLPVVPGVTVLYGEDSSSANDFDLHLVHPPMPTPLPPSIELGHAAVATAVREHLQRWGGKTLAAPPRYTGDMLPFLAGARIVGVTFPEAWSGKWCMGWHDGVAGAFPAKAVHIAPPRPNEIPLAGSGSDSGMAVVARWKWQPQPEETTSSPSVWLTFDKGETISNVKCLYADHWCWAGTNSRGRFGVFPRSHILPHTLQQETRAPPPPPAKTGGGWTTKSLFKGSTGHGPRPRPASSSAGSTVSSSTGGRTRMTR